MKLLDENPTRAEVEEKFDGSVPKTAAFFDVTTQAFYGWKKHEPIAKHRVHQLMLFHPEFFRKSALPR